MTEQVQDSPATATPPVLPNKTAWGKYVVEVLMMLIIIAIGFAFIFTSTPFAQWVGEPAFAPWGLFVGGSFFVVALSHVLRRLLFPDLKLHSIAMTATSSPTGAGLVFLGVCLVVTAFVMTMGAAIRVGG
jgi:hypothetical protein